MIGGPLFMAIALAVIGVWVVLLALPALRRPPPGCEGRLCPRCNEQNEEGEKCKKCGAPFAIGQ